MKGIKALYVGPGLYKVKKLYWNISGRTTSYPNHALTLQLLFSTSILYCISLLHHIISLLNMLSDSLLPLE